jgi:crotonobetainyl-CoA:carnitine CoA-transferase CaiB-like acyl-CoA transferase
LTPLVAFGRTPGVAGPAPSIGQHTDSVLRELGYDEATISDLRARGVIGGA